MLPTNEQLLSIKNKIVNDNKYNGLTVSQIVDMINAEHSKTPPEFKFSLTKSEFVTLISPAIIRISSLSSDKQAKWNPLVQWILATPGQNVDIAKVSSILSDAVNDGLVTLTEAAYIQNSAKKEILTTDAMDLGFAYLDESDVQAALNL